MQSLGTAVRTYLFRHALNLYASPSTERSEIRDVLLTICTWVLYLAHSTMSTVF